MAVSTPSNLYTGGAVVFNSQPYTNFYLQNIARKRAHDEALDNYYRDFNKSINPAGMRTQDIENGWMQKVNDFRGYYQQNKEAIKNPRLDNGKAFNEYMGRFQDINADIQRSKNLADKSNKLVIPIVSDPNKRSRLRESGVNAIHAHDLSMYDPNHVDLDESVLDYSAKPFDIAAQKKLDQLATQGVKMSNMVQDYTVDPKTKTRVVSYHAEFSPDDLKTIGSRYATAYSSDDSFANAVDDIAHDPDVLTKYNQLFKTVYGRDMQQNEDLAAAYGLSRVQSELNTQKASGYSPYSPWDYLATREAYHDYTQDDINNSVDARVDDQIARAEQELSNQPKNTLYGTPVYLTADPATLKAMNVDNFQYVGNGKIVPIWHETIKDEKGNEQSVERQGTPITVDDYKAAMGKRNVGAKYFEKKTKPAQQKSSSQIKKTIKRSDIASKAQAAGYSTEEYEKLLKQNGVQIIE